MASILPKNERKNENIRPNSTMIPQVELFSLGFLTEIMIFCCVTHYFYEQQYFEIKEKKYQKPLILNNLKNMSIHFYIRKAEMTFLLNSHAFRSGI